MQLRIVFLIFLIAVASPGWSQKPQIAVVMDLSQDSLMSAAKVSYFVESIGKHISPLTVDDATFHTKALQIQALKTRLCAVNIFIPGHLKVVGPDADEAAVFEYADRVMLRVKELGISLIIWGSGGSRRLPEGYDKAMATRQFVSIAQKIADRAKQYGLTIALENLNSTETNFLTSLADCVDVVRQVNRMNFRLSPDIYHMLKENEGPELLALGRLFIVHIDIAEKEGRTPPGTHGEDFTPYLRELKKMGYKGKITLECNWSNQKEQLQPARIELQRQIDLVWGK